jgi:hypothetical protein
MLNVITQIEIQQNDKIIKGRKALLYFDFVCNFEATDSWENFTNKCSVTLPYSVYFSDENNRKKLINNIGGFTDSPTFLKGDKIKINAGYKYYPLGIETTNVSLIFEGFITNITSAKPFTLECEDYMYLLKQIPAKGGSNNYFRGKKYTVEKIVQELIDNSQYKGVVSVNQKTQTNIGDYVIESNMTVAEVLDDLRKNAHLESFFRGNELQIGFLVYDEQLALRREMKQKKIFIFQHNIIEESLIYKRRDDVVLSAVACSINEVETGSTTKSGVKKTKNERLEVLVYNKNGELVGIKKEKGKSFPENKEGERRTFYFKDVTNSDTLIQRAKDKLKDYFYSGFSGSFTTFGIPFVKSGDNVYLIDKSLPERSGYYKVKAVKYSGGTNGLRQDITLDYKIPKGQNEIDEIIKKFDAWR